MDLMKKIVELKDIERKEYQKATNDRDRNYAHGALLAYKKIGQLLENACVGNTSEREQANEILPLVSKPCHTTEIVQKYSDGTEEVKYRRPYGSKEALEMMQDVDKRCRKDGYFYRHVC